jgi:hypothetical protein
MYSTKRVLPHPVRTLDEQRQMMVESLAENLLFVTQRMVGNSQKNSPD